MARPSIPEAQPALDAIYDSLPEHYRVADATVAPAGSYPLYRWLSGIASQLSVVQTMLAGFDYDDTEPGSTSTLADPTVAELAWLPWLAQLVGVPLDTTLTEEEQRDAVLYASAGWRAGTKSAIANAAKTALTGTKAVAVYDHSVSTIGDGGEWDVLVVTRTSETPDVPAVLEAIVRRGAKPAGVQLHHVAFESTWDDITGDYPTWDDIEAAGSWTTLQEAGL